MSDATPVSSSTPSPSPSTCVVVLGFAHRNSDALSQRLSAGVEEFFRRSSSQQSSTASTWLLCTGGDTEALGTTEGQDLASRAAELGVPRDRILVEDKARYTIENALFACRLLRERDPGVSQLVVVTNDFHMPRSLLVFTDVAKMWEGKNGAQISVEALPASNGDPALLEKQTGKSLAQWLAQEDKQLKLLRSECGSDFGNILSQRIQAHSDLPAAAKHNNTEALRSFVARNPSVPVDSQVRRGGSTALFYAVLHGCVQAADMLLKAGADPNRTNDNGCTPLHFVDYAPDDSGAHLAELLTAAGADPDVQGKSALWGGDLHSPASLKEAGLAKAIAPPRLRRVGSLLAFGDAHYSLLVEAARDGDAEAVRRWIAENKGGGGMMGVDGPEGYRGNTALSHAASGGSAECVSLLLDAGADVSLPGPPRASAFHYCAFKLHRQCAEIMMAKGGEERVKKALASNGESALWSSLGALKPHELALYVSHQAKNFGEELAAFQHR